MIHAEALRIAEGIVQQLTPHCERIEIAGSIRRGKPDVKDIEVVAIPKPYDVGLFASGIALVVDQWEKVRGELPCKYTQRILPAGIKLDLFMCEPNNWGLIYALRTGPSEWNQSFLLPSVTAAGLVMRDGYLWRGSQQIYVRSEADLFRILGKPFADATERK
jgi:DNA polymerase/3'-5' exonuclease PolX